VVKWLGPAKYLEGQFSKGKIMQMVKIQIPERGQRAKALVEMSRRGRVICLPDEVFIVPEPALELLQTLGVSFQELGRGGFDYAEKALRDATAAKAQRQPASQP
jgi:hypothetical protein